MDNLFQSKWFIRIISLMLAISFYFFATYEPDDTNKKGILPSFSKETVLLEDMPLNVKMDADNYVVSGVPEYVEVTLEGRASVLAPVVRQKNFSAYIDLTELGEGEHFVDIKYENIPDDIDVYIEPKTIEVVVEKRAAKEFPLEVDFVNMDKLPVDYEIGEVLMVPETVTIVSSSSVLDKVAMVKVYVDVTDLKESIRNKEMPISVSDVQGNDLNVLVEPGSAVISVNVDRPSKKMPVTVKTKGELPEGLTLESAEVAAELDVFGKTARLNELEEMVTEKIDLSTIEKSGEIEVPVVVPEGIVTNVETVKVKVVLEQAREFENVTIELGGLGDKLFSFITPEEGKTNIVVTGSDKLVAGLKQADVKLFADVTGLEFGEHQLAIEVELLKEMEYELAVETITVLLENAVEEEPEEEVES